MATSDRVKDGLLTIQQEWSVLDVLQALDMLGALSEVDDILMPDPPKS